jgi:hypothetical protein
MALSAMPLPERQLFPPSSVYMPEDEEIQEESTSASIEEDLIAWPPIRVTGGGQGGEAPTG